MVGRNVLITGASGSIGATLMQKLSIILNPTDNLNLLEHNSKITSPPDKAVIIKDIKGKRFDLALHLAANIHTKYSDKPERKADFVRDNVDLTRAISNISDRIIMISSDNVFNGFDMRAYSENETVSPANGYGWTKAWAEDIVTNRPGGAVIRITSLLGTQKNLIIDRVIDGIEGRNYRPFWTDQYLRPTNAQDLFLAMRKIIQGDKTGIFHVNCEGPVLSRADLADMCVGIYKKHGLPLAREALDKGPCDNPNFPRYYALDTAQTRQDLEIPVFQDVSSTLTQHILSLKS